MTATAASAVEKRKKPWTKARVIDLLIDILCFVVVGAASLTCILPFIHILAKSLSDNAYVVANKVLLLPKSDVGVNLEAYNKVFHDPTIMQSLWVTVLVTVVFTAIGMFLTVCASYALTRPELRGRKVMTFMIMFTMYFTAGTIPEDAAIRLFYVHLRAHLVSWHNKRTGIVSLPWDPSPAETGPGPATVAES